jgi:hypothetical protein
MGLSDGEGAGAKDLRLRDYILGPRNSLAMGGDTTREWKTVGRRLER